MKKGFINKLKGVLASAAAVVMTVGMIGGNAIPAMADTNYGVGDDTTGYTITIKGDGTEAGHTYKAYQIFGGDLYEEKDENGKVTKRTLSNVVAGADLQQNTEDTTKPNASLVTALKSDTTLSSDFTSLADTATAAQIADAITAANISNNSDKAIALARILNNNIITSGGKTSSTYDTTNKQYTISGLKAGYYLVVDQAANPGTDKNYSRLILEVLSNQEVKPKANIPTLDKKITGVKEGETSVQNPTLDEDGKAAVAKVGSTVSFQLTGQVPNTTGYSQYTYKITDTLSTGLDFVATSADTSNVQVYIGGTAPAEANKITSGYTATVSGKSLTVTIDKSTLDAHQATGDAAAPAIYVTYDAKVNASAVNYSFDENSAKLEYSNNPESETTKETEEQRTYVVNINLDVKKVDADTKTKTLSGAEFKLYRLNGSTEEYYKWDETNGVTWVDDSEENPAETFTTNQDGNFTQVIRGLDKGTYYLKETKAPNGYNLLAKDIQVDISAARDTTDTNKVNYTVTFKDKGDNGNGKSATLTNGTFTLGTAEATTQPKGTITVENGAGSTLPSTGGIGTTIFYVIGGVVIAGAVILLIARRRKNA